MIVIEKNGSLVAGPGSWGSLAHHVGLRGNAIPELPFVAGDGLTVRKAVWEPGSGPEGTIPVRGDWADGRVTDAGEWSAPTAFEPPPVPDSITMRQLLIGLMGAGWILPAEADAWSADGTLPATITTVINALPTEAERVAARITARKMSDAYRNDPLLIAAAQAAMPDADAATIDATLDQAFREWSQL